MSLQPLIEAVTELQDEVTTLTTAVDFKKEQLDDAVNDAVEQVALSIEAKDDAIEAKENAQLAQLGAETAQLGAETARDAILDKAEINLTTAGNILRADGTTYKAVNETSFLQSKVPFENSFLAGFNNLKLIQIYDSFNRPNSSNLGFTDSGHEIIKLKGTSGNILNNTCRITNSGDINGVEVNITNTSRVKINVISNIPIFSATTSGLGINSFIYILKDINNGVVLSATSQFIIISKLVNGVITNLSSVIYIANDPNVNRSMINNSLTLNTTFIFGTLAPSMHSRISLNQDIQTSLSTSANTTSLFDPLLDNVFTNPTDINYIGWAGSNNIIISIDQ